MNNIELGNHLRLIDQLMVDIVKLYGNYPSDDERAQIDVLWGRIISIATILRDQCNPPRILSEIVAAFSFDVINDSDGSAWVTLKHQYWTLSRAEAIYYRDLFSSKGLDMFRVAYGINGTIECVDNGVDIYQELLKAWGNSWNIWVSPTKVYHLKPNTKQPVIPQEIAQEVYDKIVSLYPSIEVAVYYGPDKTLSVRGPKSTVSE